MPSHELVSGIKGTIARRRISPERRAAGATNQPVQETKYQKSKSGEATVGFQVAVMQSFEDGTSKTRVVLTLEGKEIVVNAVPVRQGTEYELYLSQSAWDSLFEKLKSHGQLLALLKTVREFLNSTTHELQRDQPATVAPALIMGVLQLDTTGAFSLNRIQS